MLGKGVGLAVRDVVTKEAIALQAEVLRPRQRNEVISAIARLLFTLVRLAGVRLHETRIPDGAAKAKLLAAIARARASLPLEVVAASARPLSLAVPRVESTRARVPTRRRQQLPADDSDQAHARGSPDHARPGDQRQLAARSRARPRAARPAHREALRFADHLGPTHSRTRVTPATHSHPSGHPEGGRSRD